MAELRAHYFHKVKAQPHYQHPLPKICNDAQEEAGTAEYTCQLKDADGQTCGRIFSNKKKFIWDIFFKFFFNLFFI